MILRQQKMDIVRYQKFVNKSSIFPRSTQGRNLSYLVMGMVEEVGEIYEFVLKQDSLDENHPQHNILSKYLQEQINKELGDLMWYITAICNEMNYPLSHLIQYTKVKNDMMKENLNMKLILYLGEISGAVKKLIRDDNEVLTNNKKNVITTNLCYILSFILQLCNNNKISLGKIVEINANKIKNRIKNNTIHGSGNDR